MFRKMMTKRREKKAKEKRMAFRKNLLKHWLPYGNQPVSTDIKETIHLLEGLPIREKNSGLVFILDEETLETLDELINVNA